MERYNGAGLAWSVTIGAGSSTTISSLNGILVGTVSKTADQPTSSPGGTNGYTITVSNYAETPHKVASVTDRLPTGFSSHHRLVVRGHHGQPVERCGHPHLDRPARSRSPPRGCPGPRGRRRTRPIRSHPWAE